MKRVTIYTIGQEQLEIAGDWVRIRTEFPSLHPILPWNVDPNEDDTVVAMKDEHAEIIKVRRYEGGRVEDRYVAIGRELAALLIPALQPVAQKLLENEIQERRAVEARARLAQDEHGRAFFKTQGALMEMVNRVSDFESLPLHKRLWRAWKGRL